MAFEPRVVISDEKQFLFRDAYNRGYVQLPRMVASCLFLSPPAKIVYTSISLFVYEHGRSAFPSIHRLAVMTGMTAKSVTKYVKELEDTGFIEKVRRGNGMTNDYYIKELHEVQALYASETLWRVLEAVASDSGNWDCVEDAWRKYLKHANEAGIDLVSVDYTDNVLDAIKKDLHTIVGGGEPVMFKVLKVVNKTKTAGDVAAPTDKQGWTYKDRHEAEWRLADFKRYFYEKYKERTQMSHVEAEKVHTGILSRVLKQLDGDKTMLKKYIDAFFEIGYDNPSLEVFGTSGRQSEIATYLNTGKKPYYIDSKNRVKSHEQDLKSEPQYHGLDEDEFIKRLTRSDDQ